MLVIGGGVAGIEAASAAKSMGASVSVYDKDPAVRDQVEVLGAEFLVAEGADQEEYGAAEVCGPHLAFCTILCRNFSAFLMLLFLRDVPQMSSHCIDRLCFGLAH